MDYSKAIKELEDVRFALIKDHNSQLASIDDTIKMLRMREKLEDTGNGTMRSDYDSGWKTSQKIAFFFKRENRFMHNRELSEIANRMEPETSAEDFASRFSNVLSRLKREGQLTSIQIGKSYRNTFWGKPEWLDENRNVKKGYEYKEEYLADNEKKTSLFT